MGMIRDIEWEDMKGIVRNYYSFFDELQKDPSFGLILSRDKPGMELEAAWFASLYTAILKGNAIAAVAQEGAEIAGICDVHRIRPGTSMDHVGLLGIALRREFRGKGIGRQLLEYVIKNTEGRFEQLELSVFATNKAAIRLYESLGFREYGRTHGTIKRGKLYIDEIMMYRMMK